MRKLLLSSALLLGLIAPALSQTLPVPGAWSGTEIARMTTNAGGASGLTLNHFRNTQGYLLVPATGTVTSSPNWYQALLVATGAITNWTVNLPNPAPDGMLFTVDNSTTAAIGSVTVQTQTGPQTQTLTNPFAAQSLAANGGAAKWLYSYSNFPNIYVGTWTRIQ